MADVVGQIYFPGTPAELRSQMLRDLRLGAIEDGISDPPVEPGTDWYGLADSTSRICFIGISNGNIRDDAANVLTATRKNLEDLRERFGVEKQLPSGSTGAVVIGIVGSTTINEGQQLLLPNGLRLAVVGNYINPSDQSEIAVRAIDVGEETNLGGGELVRFASTPPINVKTEAYVSKSAPLTGGISEESDERKRRRILNKLRNVPGGGNWAHVRKIANDTDGSIDDCFVYPALGGPGTFLAVPVRPMNAALKQFTRAPSAGQIQRIRAALFAEFADAVNVKLRAPTDQTVDFGVEIQIPDSSLSGGNGQGWVDGTPWPQLEAADAGRVSITTPALNGRQITVTAATAVAPVPLVTNVSWWSTNDGRFYTSLVTAVGGSSGAWVLTLQKPFVDSDGDPCVAGEFISPAAVNIARYGDTWLSLFGGLGPGEMLSSADSRRPRSSRHPYVSREWPSDWADALLRRLADNHSEITSWSREYASATSPTIPATVDDSPNILVPGNVGFYPL